MDLSEFPESEIIGSDYSDVDYKYMRAAAEQSSKISKDEWEKILDEHSKFIKAGGGNGSWQTMNLNGVVLGLYSGSKIDIGSHALLNNRSLSNLKLSNILLSYANLIGILAEKVDFTNSNLNHCIMTDSFLDGAVFDNANLIGVDFSRCKLRNSSFKNANLKYADFENCDLTNSDFTGAKLQNSRFPGAKLINIKR